VKILVIISEVGKSLAENMSGYFVRVRVQ